MEDFSQFFSLLQVSDLSWGWKALLFYTSIFLIFAVITAVQMIFGCAAVFAKFREVAAENIFSTIRSNSLPPITFIIPAYNEQSVIVHTVKNLLSLSYRNKKILIINDGSTDDTFQLLLTNFALRKVPPSHAGTIKTAKIRGNYVSNKYPDLYVIDKENGNKADALNAGLNACDTDIFVAADADTLVDDKALSRLIRPFLLKPITSIAHASIGLLNGCKIGTNRIIEYIFPKKLISGLQAVDYMKSFLIERMGLSWTKGALVVPGNFGLFKTDIIRDLGGYDVTSLVEDTEIVTHLHDKMLSEKKDYEITYIPDIIAWTAGPETVKGLIRQRVRWYTGTTQNILKYSHMWFRPKYRSIGLFVCPMTLFEKVAPLIEISGFVILALALIFSQVNFFIVIALVIASWLFVSLLIAFTALMDVIVYETYSGWNDFKRIGKSVLCYFGYHYILLYCRIRGLFVPKKATGGWTPDRMSYEEVERG
jgi:cellulose synthase/poly-beta-1,6-N-acetylglucosamine synthase-like glycosyltransferase